VVEGFVASELREVAVAADITIDPSWQSLKLIQEVLRVKDSLTADEIVEPLRKLHYLRSKVRGHHTGERTKLEAEAVKEHGSLPGHFRALCAKCDDSFERVVAALTTGG